LSGSDWFAHELAWQFGEPDPQCLLRRISSVQFNQWLAFYCQKNGIKTDSGDDQEVLAAKFKAIASMHSGIERQLDGD